MNYTNVMVIASDWQQKSPPLIPHLLVHLHEVGTHELKACSLEDQLPVKRNDDDDDKLCVKVS